MFDKKDPIYNEDLINSGEPIIIQQKGDNDKKFIYTLLILLVVLFIIALGVIAFLGAKYFGADESKNVATANKTEVTQPVATNTKKIEQIVKNNAPQTAQTKVEEKTQEPSLEELEQIVNNEKKEPQKTASAQTNTNMQNAINNAASSSGAKLTAEEMAKIAKMVAAELAKVQQQQQQTSNKNQAVQTEATSKEDAALLQSLQAAETDTLKSQQVNTQALKDEKVKSGSNNQAVDTFNKVVVENKQSGNDELAALTQEIDTLLQTEEVTKKKESLAYKKQLMQEVESRKKGLRYIVVKPGDTLSSIAYRAYGKASAYVKIYEANPDLIKNPNRIYVGQKLKVPLE